MATNVPKLVKDINLQINKMVTGSPVILMAALGWGPSFTYGRKIMVTKTTKKLPKSINSRL